MKIVKAYDLNIRNDENREIDIPKGAEILSVAVGREPYIGVMTKDVVYVSVKQDADTQKNVVDKYEFVFIETARNSFCVDQYNFLGTIGLRYSELRTNIYNVFYRKLNKD